METILRVDVIQRGSEHWLRVRAGRRENRKKKVRSEQGLVTGLSDP